MSPQLKLVSSEPEESAYAKPLSDEAKAQIAAIVAGARRLECLASGSFITHASKAQIPGTLRDIEAALKAIQGGRR